MEIPSGGIIVWSGAIGSIPVGFVLCDGNNDTPDLRNRFIAGAGDVYVVDQTGGALEHDHSFTTDGHQHLLDAGADVASGASWDNTSSVETDTGTTEDSSSLPPWYALAYIMKT